MKYEYRTLIDQEGNKFWLMNNLLHKENGPAIEWADGHKDWYINDENLFCQTQEEFERYMKLKAFW